MTSKTVGRGFSGGSHSSFSHVSWDQDAEKPVTLSMLTDFVDENKISAEEEKNCNVAESKIKDSSVVPAQTSMHLGPPSSGRREIVILVGPPVAGKTTIAPLISSLCRIPFMTTRDILMDVRGDDSRVAAQIRSSLSRGKLVDDDIMIEAIRARTQWEDCDSGFILDGFPRNVEQASALDRCLEETGDSVTHAIALEAPDSVLSERMSGRWVHARSGRAYHEVACPPKSLQNCFHLGDGLPQPTAENMLDDETGEPLMQRTADNELVFTIALRNYYSQTLPVLEHYQKKTAPSVASESTVESVMELGALLGDGTPSTSPQGIALSSSLRSAAGWESSFPSPGMDGSRTLVHKVDADKPPGEVWEHVKTEILAVVPRIRSLKKETSPTFTMARSISTSPREPMPAAELPVAASSTGSQSRKVELVGTLPQEAQAPLIASPQNAASVNGADGGGQLTSPPLSQQRRRRQQQQQQQQQQTETHNPIGFDVEEEELRSFMHSFGAQMKTGGYLFQTEPQERLLQSSLAARAARADAFENAFGAFLPPEVKDGKSANEAKPDASAVVAAYCPQQLTVKESLAKLLAIGRKTASRKSQKQHLKQQPLPPQQPPVQVMVVEVINSDASQRQWYTSSITVRKFVRLWYDHGDAVGRATPLQDWHFVFVCATGEYARVARNNQMKYHPGLSAVACGRNTCHEALKALDELFKVTYGAKAEPVEVIKNSLHRSEQNEDRDPQGRRRDRNRTAAVAARDRMAPLQHSKPVSRSVDEAAKEAVFDLTWLRYESPAKVMIVEVINGEGHNAARLFRNSITLRQFLHAYFLVGPKLEQSGWHFIFVSPTGRYTKTARDNQRRHHPNLAIMACSYDRNATALHALDDRFDHMHYDGAKEGKRKGSRPATIVKRKKDAALLELLRSIGGEQRDGAVSTEEAESAARDFNQRARLVGPWKASSRACGSEAGSDYVDPEDTNDDPALGSVDGEAAAVADARGMAADEALRSIPLLVRREIGAVVAAVMAEERVETQKHCINAELEAATAWHKASAEHGGIRTLSTKEALQRLDSIMSAKLGDDCSDISEARTFSRSGSIDRATKEPAIGTKGGSGRRPSIRGSDDKKYKPSATQARKSLSIDRPPSSRRASGKTLPMESARVKTISVDSTATGSSASGKKHKRNSRVNGTTSKKTASHKPNRSRSSQLDETF